MIRKLSATLLLFAGTVLAQTSMMQAADTSTSSTSAVAYLYFSEFSPGHDSLVPGLGRTQIAAYRVAADGSLTKIPGSPFAVNGYTTQMCVNGKYLFASTHIELANNQYPRKMNSYRIGTGGTLTLSHILGNADLTNITLDHRGETLYGQKSGLPDLLSYEVRWSDGGLEYLGQVTATDLDYRKPWLDLPVTFTGDNFYAYGTTTTAYLRDANHKLIRSWSGVSSSGVNPQPVAFATAADPSNNLAGIVGGPGEGPFGLVSYQVGANGSLTTTATADTITPINLKDYDSLNMSSSGKFLAVGGTGGVQIFHWNGASAPTPFAQVPIAAAYGNPVVLLWDNANHLFAYVEGFTPPPNYGYLYVWTVTENGVTSAPGSPHKFYGPITTVTGPGMAVQSLTPQAQ